MKPNLLVPINLSNYLNIYRAGYGDQRVPIISIPSTVIMIRSQVLPQRLMPYDATRLQHYSKI